MSTALSGMTGANATNAEMQAADCAKSEDSHCPMRRMTPADRLQSPALAALSAGNVAEGALHID